MIKPGSTIGIIGGGQLGRMTAMAAYALGYDVCIYSDSPDSPALKVTNKSVIAPYNDKAALEKFLKLVDVVTFEFENIPHDTVKLLQDKKPVRPNWQVLYTSQNRLREKDFVNALGIGTAPYKKVTSEASLKKAYSDLGPRCILKTVELGYDGKGQAKITKEADLKGLWSKFKTDVAVLEGMVEFTKEISVIVARGEDGKCVCYTPVENIHKNGILDETIAPAKITPKLNKSACDIAKKIANKLDLIGILAVEMFVTKKGEILVNELAPRPHNSGHWTIDACVTSQFEQFVRAVCGLPLGNPNYHSKAVMKNLIGDDIKQWPKIVKKPNAKLHLYGKTEAKPGRKMGHVTFVE